MTEADIARLTALLERIVDSDSTELSTIKPSEWVEQNMYMEEPFPGLYRYWLTPYCREIIDTFAKDHPMLWIAIMKGAQIGISSGVLIPVLLWSIVHDPARIYFLVGSPDLVGKASEKLTKAIHRAGISKYIQSQVNLKRQTKSGDTTYKKDFEGGFIQIGSPSNHEDIRDVSLRKGLFDDFEAVKSASKKSGSTRKMLEQRFAAYEGRHKIAYVSTPELAENSNIEEAYLLGDQRKYLIPCPCCGTLIEWRWKVENGDKWGGIVWEYTGDNTVKPGSVRYRCQECGDTFDDRNKMDLLNAGRWVPTAEPKKPGFYSYHISALYAPIGMFSWEHYANDYVEACPVGQPRKEELYKTFVNVVLGETYKPDAEAPKAADIQRNQRDYAIGVIPEAQSIADGNGMIVMLTCAADMNGTVAGINGARENDARLDYEVVAWSESGACYSVQHGSIGTFIPRERSLLIKQDRVKWTYEKGKPNSVWPVYNEVSRQVFKTDTGRSMRVHRPGVDVGAYTDFVIPYIDFTIRAHPDNPTVGLRGDKEDEFVLDARNVPLYKDGTARSDVKYLQVGLIKDRIANFMKLNWDPVTDKSQPDNFMNYPMSQIFKCPVKAKYHASLGVSYDGDYLYQLDNFFAHYESERRSIITRKMGGLAFRWAKIDNIVQNHMWDCRVYNYALREINLRVLAQSLYSAGHINIKPAEFTWTDYVTFIKS